ncbi:MAG: hypothetical protein CMJ69_08270 [Planctomycetaceae bacterium]|nr:hypothetical protein [Planctomycetaceae bacterium]
MRRPDDHDNCGSVSAAPQTTQQMAENRHRVAAQPGCTTHQRWLKMIRVEPHLQMAVTRRQLIRLGHTAAQRSFFS